MTASSTDIPGPSEATPAGFRLVAHEGLSGTGRSGTRLAGPQLQAYRDGIKPVLDMAAILLTAPLTVPVILFLALCVMLSGHSPFYSQSRIGRNGRVYTMWKLRTMIDNADAALEEHLATDPAARAEWDHAQKLRNDPRITRIGRLLRKSSLDELPQLWNVFRGDMSLVGPRPMMPSQASLYPGQAYYRLRPGITGMWQVSARNDSSFAERAGFDADYDRTVSLGTDIGLLWATVRVVLRGTGH